MKTLKAIFLVGCLACSLTSFASDDLNAYKTMTTSELSDEVQKMLFEYYAKTPSGNVNAYQIANRILEKGHNSVAYKVRAHILYNGLGVAVDKEGALNDFIMASDDDAGSAYMAGFMLIHGDGVESDIDYGLDFMLSAAKQKHPKAMSDLAVLYLDQSREESNEELKHQFQISSYKYATQCAQQKNIQCIQIVEQFFREGLGDIEVNVEAADRLALMVRKLKLETTN